MGFWGGVNEIFNRYRDTKAMTTTLPRQTQIYFTHTQPMLNDQAKRVK